MTIIVIKAKLINSFMSLQANDILDYAEKLALKDGTLNSSQILFCLCVFMELNFIEFDEKLNVFTVLKSKKAEINSSQFYKTIIGE